MTSKMTSHWRKVVVTALAGALLPACSPATPPDHSDQTLQARVESAPMTVLGWCEVLQALPDDGDVPNSSIRDAIRATNLPWHVREKASGIELRLIPPGKFLRGARETEGLAEPSEEQMHEVVISRPFYLGVTEVTIEQWLRYEKDEGHPRFLAPEKVSIRNPVVEVSWSEAQRFLESFGLRFPSEAEWEYAARGGSDQTYSWGSDINLAAHHENLAANDTEPGWTSADLHPWNDGAPKTAPVKSYRANPFGLHDMLGNVKEWCQDDSAGLADKHSPPPPLGPTGPSRGTKRVLRGGSWMSGVNNLGPSIRSLAAEIVSDSDIGLRAARNPH